MELKPGDKVMRIAEIQYPLEAEKIYTILEIKSSTNITLVELSTWAGFMPKYFKKVNLEILKELGD